MKGKQSHQKIITIKILPFFSLFTMALASISFVTAALAAANVEAASSNAENYKDEQHEHTKKCGGEHRCS
jgi:hypothetical protein